MRYSIRSKSSFDSYFYPIIPSIIDIYRTVFEYAANLDEHAQNVAELEVELQLGRYGIEDTVAYWETDL